MIPKKPLLYVLAIAIAVVFSGCAKKPRRPNPLDTVGPGGSSSQNQTQFDSLAGDGTFADPGDQIPIQTMEGEGIRGIITEMIYFDFDSSSIKPSERGKLTIVADYLRNNPGTRLILEGHCDWRGTPEYNLGLGERRAESVNQYLQTLGISANRLENLSKGDLNAIEGASEEVAKGDRRVEFLVVR